MKTLKKYQGKNMPTGPDRIALYPVSRLSPPIELVDLAREIQQADQFINTRVGAKLQIIADQITSLQNKARTILEEARQEQELHRAQCSFKKKVGCTYHLYKRRDGSCYVSMLSPQDWQGKPPHPFAGSYRLEADMSWTPVDQQYTLL